MSATTCAHSPSRRSALQRLAPATAALAAALPLWAASKLQPGNDAALIVVEVQNCLATAGTPPVARGEEVGPVINKRSVAFADTVVTQDWHTAGQAFFAGSHAGKKPFETTKLADGQQVLWPDHCVQGSNDAALHTGLAVDLKARDIQAVYGAGLAADFCLARTAMAACKAGFTVDLVEDACRAIDLNGPLAAACKQWAAKGGQRIQRADVVVARSAALPLCCV